MTPAAVVSSLALARGGVEGPADSPSNCLRQGEDQKPDQSADQCAINADVLQVLADLQLNAIYERRGVPIIDHRGDIAADFRPPPRRAPSSTQPQSAPAEAKSHCTMASRCRGRSSVSDLSSSSHSARACSVNTGLARISCFKASPCARISGLGAEAS